MTFARSGGLRPESIPRFSGPGSEHIPEPARIDLGRTCNNGCERCRVRPSLGTQEALARVRSIPEECRQVLLFGGEPCIRKDFLELVTAIDRTGRGLVLVSNARMFSLDRFAQSMSCLRIESVRIPVMASDPRAVDRVAAVEGAFEQSMAGARNLARLGIAFEFHLVGFGDDPARSLLTELSGTRPARIVRLELTTEAAREAIDWPLCFGNGHVREATAVSLPGPAAESGAGRGAGPCDVLLVQPDYEGSVSIMVPQSLLAVAGPLVQRGHAVTILDRRLEPDWRAAVDRALEGGARCVGVTFLTGKQIAQACETIDYVKQKSPGTLVVTGGLHSTLLPEQTVAYEGIDVAVVGEGEATFLELVEASRSGRTFEQVKGIVFKDASGRIVRTPGRERVNLDDYAKLPWSLLDRYGDRYEDPTLHTSRGCPHRCAYCAIPLLAPGWKAQSPSVVVEQVKVLLARGARHIAFLDDAFYVDLGRVEAILDAFEREELQLSWMTEMRVDDALRMGERFLARLASRGMRSVYVGAESGSRRLLELVGKRITPEMTLRANALLRDAGIAASYSFMTDLPTETQEEFEQTRQLVEQLKREAPESAVWRINSYTPYPGTALFDKAVQEGFVPPDSLRGWMDLHMYRRRIPIAYDREL